MILVESYKVAELVLKALRIISKDCLESYSKIYSRTLNIDYAYMYTVYTKESLCLHFSY